MSDSDPEQECLINQYIETPSPSTELKNTKWCYLWEVLISGLLIYIIVLCLGGPASFIATPKASMAFSAADISSPIFDENSFTFLQHSKDREPFPKKTPRGNYKDRVLCKILKDAHCQSSFIADVIDLFWVVAPIYSFDFENDLRYWLLHDDFKSCMQSYGIPFITIEAIRLPENRKPTGSAEPSEYWMTVPDNEPYDIQVYYYNMSCIRENLLNVAIKKLDKQAPWEYVAWIDAHQYFENPYWWEETIYKTERYGSVQLFDLVDYLDKKNRTDFPKYGVIRQSLVRNDIDFTGDAFGNAYAVTRDIYNRIGYIYDEAVAAGPDCAYTLASFPEGVGFELWAPLYYKNFEPWINHTRQVFKGRRTFVRGNMKHFYHGGSFPYFELNYAAERVGFNATLDLRRDQNSSLYIANKEVSSVFDWVIYNSKMNSRLYSS